MATFDLGVFNIQVLRRLNTQLHQFGPDLGHDVCGDAVPQDPSLATRLTIMTVSCLITAALCEGMVRFADDNARPMIRLFEQNQVGDIGLSSNGSARIGRAIGEPWEIHTDDAGRRLPPSTLTDSAWVVVGDSQVMGNGVDDGAPFPAKLRIDGQAAHNLGVPGFGVGDALSRATAHLATHPAAGVIVVINQMNDWDEVLVPIGERYQVRGGWLLNTEDATGPRGYFLASPISGSHLAFLIGHLVLKDWSSPPPLAPTWMTNPDAMTKETTLMATAILRFSAAHPNTTVLPVYLPADVYASNGRAEGSPLSPHLSALDRPPWQDNRLAAQLLSALSPLAPLDLSPVLTSAENFLSGDYHLSETGHQAVAKVITETLTLRAAQAQDPSEVDEQ
jgi:hypothetical protein